MSELVCGDCGKSFVTKYTLATHTRRIHLKILETSEPVHLEEFACSSPRCSFTTTYRAEWKRHLDKCLFISFDQEMEKKEQHYHNLLAQKDVEIMAVQTQKDMAIQNLLAQKDWEMRELSVQKDMEIRELSVRLEMMQQAEQQLKRRADEMIDCQLKRADDMVDSQLKHANDMVEKCIDRPTVTNNNHHHNHINNILVDGKTFAEMTDPERIQEIARQKMRPYWLKGQAGVAEFLYNHVICVDDDKKLIACTDASRKKIKYTNDKNEVEDDLGATKFIAKVYQPIRTVSNELHDNITEQIQEDESSHKIDRFSAELQREQAIQAAMDIVRIRDSERNQSFTTKLCSLAKV
jgi:hypothetical protein